MNPEIKSNTENINKAQKNNENLKNINLQKLPNGAEWSSDDRGNEIVENGEIEQGKIIEECKKECSKLKEELNLPNIDGITINQTKNVKQNGELVGVKKLKLEQIIHRGQKLSITTKSGEKINVVWGKSEKGEMTFIKEGTKKRALIYDGDKIGSYDESLNKKIEVTRKIGENKETDQQKFKNKLTLNTLSAPTYKSQRGITLCSRTARENLQNFGIKNIKQGSSAKASFEKYSGNAIKFPPKNENANIVDLYLDASPKNKQYGHRAVGIKIKGNWYVLDPYYTGTRKPFPAENYIAKMEGKGRKFWGGHIVA